MGKADDTLVHTFKAPSCFDATLELARTEDGNERVYFLQCESTAACDGWIQALQGAIEVLNGRRAGGVVPAGDSSRSINSRVVGGANPLAAQRHAELDAVAAAAAATASLAASTERRITIGPGFQKKYIADARDRSEKIEWLSALGGNARKKGRGADAVRHRVGSTLCARSAAHALLTPCSRFGRRTRCARWRSSTTRRAGLTSSCRRAPVWTARCW